MSLRKHGGRRHASGGVLVSYVTMLILSSSLLRRKDTRDAAPATGRLFVAPPKRWRDLEMGSLSQHRAANRFQTALQQRLDAASDPNEAQQAYDDALEALVSIAMDEIELDRIAQEFATNPDAIGFPT